MSDGTNKRHNVTVTDSTSDPLQIPGAIPPESAQNITVDDAPLSTLRDSPSGGLTIAGYDIVGELGRGGMGVVYHALQRGLSRPVAIKTILDKERAGPTALVRFLSEAEVAATLKHPAIVQVYDLGGQDHHPFLIMEYLPGGSLADQLRSENPPTPRACVAWLITICGGIAEAHARSIVHRDLKPANILFTEDGQPKVTDFGIAKRISSELTATLAQMGTPSYMAPEQAAGRAKFVGPPADVWSLGVILYECLTGERPFVGETIVDVIRQISDFDPPPPNTRNPNIDPDLNYIVMKCLRKSPADRYPSAAELAEDLDRWQRGEPLGSRRQELQYRLRRLVKRRGKSAALLVLGLGALVGAALLAPESWWSRLQPDVTRLNYRKTETALRVKALLSRPPRPHWQDCVEPKYLDALPPPDLSPFQVLYSDRVVDMRSLTPPKDSPGELGFVQVQIRQSVFKDTHAETYPLTFHTRSDNLFLNVVEPRAERSEIFAVSPSTAQNPSGEKVKRVHLNVKHIPDDGTFDCVVSATFKNAVFRQNNYWAEMDNYCMHSSILILFPETHPFKTYQISSTKGWGGPSTPYKGESLHFADEQRQWIYCEISNPNPKMSYFVNWEW